MRLVRFAVEVLLMSRGGICKLRPLDEKVDLRGVTGLGAVYESSFEVFEFSTSAGEGESRDLASWDVHGRGGIASTEGAFKLLPMISVSKVGSTSILQVVGCSCCSWAVN